MMDLEFQAEKCTDTERKYGKTSEQLFSRSGHSVKPAILGIVYLGGINGIIGEPLISSYIEKKMWIP